MATGSADDSSGYTWTRKALAYNWATFFPKMKNFKFRSDDFASYPSKDSPVARKNGQRKMDKTRKSRRKRFCIILASALVIVVLSSAVTLPLVLTMKGDSFETSKLYSEYELTIRIKNKQYSEEMGNKESAEFKMTASNYCNGINELFTNSSYQARYEGCIVTEISNGSIIIYFLVVIESSQGFAPTETDLIQALSQGVPEDEFVSVNDFQYKPSSISFGRKLTSTTSQLSAVSCGEVPLLRNGKVVSTGLMYGDNVTFSCNEGYNIIGNDQLTCKTPSYWGIAPSCEAKLCPVLNFTDHMISLNQSEYTTSFGSNVTISCKDGYQIQGNQVVFCQANGSWTALPICRLRSCPSFILPNNSITDITTQSSYTEGISLKVTCEEGYEMVMYKNCSLENGWVDSFKCEAITCGEFVPSEKSQMVNSTGTGMSYGNTITIQCDNGYTIDGITEVQITCLSNKMWSSFPTCKPVNCGPVIFPENAIRNGTISTQLNDSIEIICKDGYVLNGVGLITCLPNGSWSAIPDCIKSGCGEIPDLLNGKIVLSTGNQYLDYAIFMCEEGYDLKGNISINCMANGMWSDGPTCEQVTCPEITVINGSLNGTIGKFGDKFKVSCDMGFLIVGTDLISCQANKSWTKVPSCEKIVCNDTITLPENGYLPCFRNAVTFGDFLKVQCSLGYELKNGIDQIKCLENGSWSDIPVCSPISCPAFDYPNNSLSSNRENNTLAFNDTLMIECLPKFRLVGTEYVTCRADGTLSPKPTCEPVVCSKVDPPEKGIFRPSMQEYSNVDQVIAVSCQEGYNPSMDTNVTCLENGTWSEIATCVPIKCINLKLPSNSVLISGSLNESEYNNEVKLACTLGYQLQGNDTVVCLSNTSWGVLPECTRKVCPAYNLSENIYIVQNNSASPPRFKDYLQLNCSTGHNLVGDTIATCLENQTWSSFPICEKIRCPANDLIKHGYVVVPQEDAREYGDVTQANCDEGFERTSNHTVVCTSDGTWDGDEACTIVDCGELNITEQHMMIKNRTGTTYESRIYFECNDSYILIGKNPIYCQANKTWEDRPNCILSSCGPTNSVDDGYIRSINESSFEVLCDFGYFVNGSPVFICNPGDIQPNIPTCQPVDCGPVRSISNGNAVISSGTSYDQVIVYKCDTGYTLSGNQNVTCLGSGEWADLPECKIVNCGTPPQLLYGLYIGEKLNTTLNSILTAQCLSGYTHLDDVLTTICLSTGKWSSLIQCVPIECSDLAIVNGRVVSSTNGSMFGSVATVTCEDGFEMDSCVGTSRCNETGQWDMIEDCERIECGTPLKPINGNFEMYSLTTFETIIHITCNSGFHLLGDNFTTCGKDGLWSMNYSCERNDCGLMNTPIGVQFVHTSTTFKSLAVVECSNGKSIPVICEEAGDWLVYATNTHFTNEMCNETEVSCGLPVSIQNAEFVFVSGIKTHDHALIKCDTGYRINGNETIVCESNGNWSTYPECVIVDCGLPYPPANSRNITTENTTYGSTFDIVCVKGFTRHTNDSMICEEDGYWTVVAGCIIDCGQYDMVANGTIQFQNGTGLQSVVVVGCEDGFYLYNDTINFVRCTQFGRWKGDPYCIKEEPGKPYMRCLEKTLSELTGSNVTTECLLRDIDTIENLRILLDGTELYNETNPIQSNTVITIDNRISITVGVGSEKLSITIPIGCQNEGTFRLIMNSNVEDTFHVRVLAFPEIQQFMTQELVYLRQQTRMSCIADLGRDQFGESLSDLKIQIRKDGNEVRTFDHNHMDVTEIEGTCLNMVTMTLTIYLDSSYNNTEVYCLLMNTSDPTEIVSSSEAYEISILKSNVYFKEMDTSKSVEIGDLLNLKCIFEDVVNFERMSIQKEQDTMVTMYKNGSIVPNIHAAGLFTSQTGFLEYNITTTVCSSKGAYTCTVHVTDDPSITTVLNVHMIRLPDYPEFSLTPDAIENKFQWALYPTLCSGSLGYPIGIMFLEMDLGGNFTMLDNATIEYTNDDEECDSRGEITYFNYERFNMTLDGNVMRCVVKNDHIFDYTYSLSVSRNVHIIPVSTCNDKQIDQPFPHPYDCNAFLTCVANADVLWANGNVCKVKGQCYDLEQRRCEACETSNNCNYPTTSLPFTPAPTQSPIRLQCQDQVAASKGEVIYVTCAMINDIILLDNLEIWYVTVSHIQNILMDTRNDIHTSDNDYSKVYTNSEGFIVKVNETTIKLTITLNSCNKTGVYKVEYVTNSTLQSQAEVIISAPAQEPILSKTPSQFHRNQLSTITCSGNIGNPTSDMSLLLDGLGEGIIERSTMMRRIDEATCGYIETKSYQFYVRDYMDNGTALCETTFTNGSTISSMQEVLSISEPVMIFDVSYSTTPIGSTYVMNCKWDKSLIFEKVIVRRRSLTSDIFVDVITYDGTQVFQHIPGISGRVTDVATQTNLAISFAIINCEDEAEYTCELEMSADQIGMVQAFVYVTDTHKDPTLTLPKQLVTDTLTPQEHDFLQCSANVGYRNAYDIRIEYFDTTSNSYEEFTLGSELTLENKTTNCRSILTRRREAITFNENWDGVSIRCVVYEPTTENIIASSNATTVRLLQDRCDGTNDETYRCHPFNCRMYTRCHSSGYMSVLSCGDNQCVVIRDRPWHYAECRDDCEYVIGYPCPCSD